MNLILERAPAAIQVPSLKTPLPMQYLGGKSRIAANILGSIQKHFSGNIFIDLFAGSGVVSHLAMTKGYKVIANDLQPYSSAVLNSLLCTPITGLKNLASNLSTVSTNDLFSSGREIYGQDYRQELEFISQSETNSLSWEKYKEFCESTSLCSGSTDEVARLKKMGNWNLFLAYYRNTYFGVRQAAEIDFLRELSSKLNENLKTHLIASTISALTFCVSSTTHLAQYLKPSSHNSATNLIKRRSKSIIELVTIRLLMLAQLTRSKSGRVYNEDFLKATHSIAPNANSVIYADPPYFKEHYSRYYHILDTFTLYDFPQLTYNPRLSKTTVGRYREERLTSDFGKKSKVKSAFANLIELTVHYGSPLAISYASSSLVPKNYFHELADKHNIKLHTYEFELVHTGQGQPRHKEVTEYLFYYAQ